MSYAVKAYGTKSANDIIAPLSIQRRFVGAHDVKLDIHFCGVCHSDIHCARDQWHGTEYPCVPGHEIIGYVSEIGPAVTNFKVGDLVGVGCMVDSCKECSSCSENDEQHCSKGMTDTYNAKEKVIGGHTYGGYSKEIVVKDSFVLRIPQSLDPAAAAPLLCAGITTYSPLRRYGAGPGMKIGIVGLGGLGHVALKIAHAMGAHTVVFTTSATKIADAKSLGADEVILSTDPEQMKTVHDKLDLILDTVSVLHSFDIMIECLRKDGTLCLVGALNDPCPVTSFSLIHKRAKLTGTLIGSVKETQEMLDFCAEHKILPEIEMTTLDKINQAYERMIKSDVKYRFVIDIRKSFSEEGS